MKDEQIVHSAIDMTILQGARLIGKATKLLKAHCRSCCPVGIMFPLDTAAVYRNEHMVGGAIRKACAKHKLDRSNIFVTTKLGEWNWVQINLLRTITLIRWLTISLISIAQTDML